MPMSETQRRGLAELAAACDEMLRYHPLSDGSVPSRMLSGTKYERSSGNMRSLMVLGFAEGRKAENRQGQWTWRVTPAGRLALKETSNADR